MPVTEATADGLERAAEASAQLQKAARKTAAKNRRADESVIPHAPLQLRGQQLYLAKHMGAKPCRKAQVQVGARATFTRRLSAATVLVCETPQRLRRSERMAAALVGAWCVLASSVKAGSSHGGLRLKYKPALAVGALVPPPRQAIPPPPAQALQGFTGSPPPPIP